jgi:molybdate transport system ATP-binding protein
VLSIRVSHRLADYQLRVDVSCQYAATAIFGPSGAGKTSLLNIIAGLLRPDQGEIVLDGEVLLSTERGISMPPEARRIGYVFQDDLLFPHLSVRQNLCYGRDLLAPSGRRFQLDRIVELLEIGQLLHRHPHGLSGGERQRVALGRALLASPRLLLMDEPLASLDQGLKSRIIPYLRHIRSDLGIPILYVSHSVAEILELTGQVIVLRQGQVVAHGDLFRIAHDPEVLPLVEECGLENALQVEVVEGDAAAGVTRVSCCGHELEIPYCGLDRGQRLFVAVRAEDAVLSLNRPQGLSIRNAVPGQVLEVSRTGSTVLVYVDIGVRLAVKVTPEAAEQLKLQSGQQVFCLMKTHSMRLGPQVD